jgi:hypothetical protein
LRTKFLLVAGLICCTAFSQAVKPNFSGTWKLNHDRSAPRGDADQVYLLEVSQTAKSLTMTTKATGVTDLLDGTWALDGKPQVVKMGKLYRSRRAYWETKTLLLEILDQDSKNKETAKTVMGIRESWDLSPDGTVLTKFRQIGSVATPGKQNEQKQVFNKQ